MIKKILKEIIHIIKKLKWEIIPPLFILYFLYDEVSLKVFLYFCYLEAVMLLNVLFRNETKEFANAASKMIIVIKTNLDELKKIYQELVDYFGPDKDK